MESLNKTKSNRTTYHDIYETKHGDFYIVSSLSFRKDTQITKIDGRSGLMHYEALPGLDLFSNHRQATAYLQKKYTFTNNKVRASALLGYIVSERYAYLLVATKTRSEGDLLGVHPIYVITETQWIKIELSYLTSCKLPNTSHPHSNGNLFGISSALDEASQNPRNSGSFSTIVSETNTNLNSSQTIKDSNDNLQNVISQLQMYPLEGTHYYCETYDLTNYFPSPHKGSDCFDSEFAWNEWLRRPFQTFGLSLLCAVLLQGYASIKQLNASLSIGYIMKKSKVNPETYLFGHGINDKGGAANEYECEIIMWRMTGANTLSWTSNVWRRGTIPLWWRARSKQQGNDLQVKENPFETSDQYFNSILKRYGSIYEPSKASLPTINLVSLLKTDDPQEGPLGILYQKLCNKVMSAINLNLNLQTFDWHLHLKNNNQSLPKTVSSLWSILKDPIENSGFSKGTAKILIDETDLINDPQVLPEKRLVFEHCSYQKEIIKFNCLESLERVNIVTYFTNFQIVSLMARSLGLAFTDTYPFNNNITLDIMSSTLKRIGMFIPLTEFFVISSDVCNILYLNNLSQPTPIMREYINSISASSVNHLISLQRKYQSTNNEDNRNKQYLIFLGLFSSKYFYFNSPNEYLEKPCSLLSSAPVTTVFALPALTEKSHLSPSILIREIDDFCWIFPQDLKSAEAIIYLGHQSIVTELCITIAHGTNSDTYPQTMDVYLGDYLDSMFIALQEISIPRCTTGTKLSYEVPNCPWDQYGTSSSTEDPIVLPSNRFRNRFVKLDFRGSATPLTIGKIEIFGYHSSNAKKLSLSKHNVVRSSSLSKANLDAEFVLDTNNISTIDQDKLERTDYTPLDLLNKESNNTDNLIDSVVEHEISNVLSLLQDNQPAATILHQERSMCYESQNGLPSTQETLDVKSTESSPNEILLIRDYSGGQTFMEDDTTEDGLTETIKINSNKKKAIPSQQYMQAVLDAINGSLKQPHFKLIDALELEIKRISLNITPFERDQIIQSMQIPFNTLNPSRFIFEREEKIESNIRKYTKNKQLSNWTCQRPQCGKELGYFDKFRYKQCYYCYKRFCPSCMSSTLIKILEYESSKLLSVCNTCSSLIMKQEYLFKKIADANFKFYYESSKLNLDFYQKLLLQFQSNIPITHSYESMHKSLIPLSEYPKSTILFKVVKDIESPPIETILLPPDILPLSVYWSAPPSVNSVDICIALSYDSLVYSITLLVDSLGYYNYNVPSVDIKIGKTLSNSQLEPIGPWTFQPNGWSSNPNQVIQPQSCISYILPQPVQARMISLKFTLPNLPTFLTYDNNEPVRPFLHIGRIAIHGFYSDTLSEIPTFITSSIPMEPSDKELYENTLYSNSMITLKRNPIKTISNQVKSAKTVHINIDPSATVKGFSAIITHDDSEGVRSQAKGLTISCVTTNQKNEFVGHQYQSQVLIPKSRVNSTLYFDFHTQLPPHVHIIIFEFISNYGGNALSLPRINLY